MEDIGYFYYKDKNQQKLSSDIKKYCQDGNTQIRCYKYFENKIYKRINLTDQDINHLLVLKFIQTYHVSKVGNPSINDVKTSIALYGCIRNNNYQTLDALLETQNIKDFLIRRYIGNMYNNDADLDTLDETIYLTNSYYEYITSKNKGNQKTKKRC